MLGVFDTTLGDARNRPHTKGLKLSYFKSPQGYIFN